MVPSSDKMHVIRIKNDWLKIHETKNPKSKYPKNYRFVSKMILILEI